MNKGLAVFIIASAYLWPITIYIMVKVNRNYNRVIAVLEKRRDSSAFPEDVRG